MTTITTLLAREIKDSRGDPTVEVELATVHARAIASVPSGASVGVHEALELRDGGAVAGGRGVSQAIANVNETIAAALTGKEFDQRSLDTFLCTLDGTPNKSRLGANAILGVSIAFARASALEAKQELYAYIGALAGESAFALPQPLFNILNGGKHAPGGIDIQECMLAPIAFASVTEKVRVVTECVEVLKKLLDKEGYGTATGDEGGFAPKLKSNEEALDLLVATIKTAGYTTEQIKIALDVAASSLYVGGEYTVHQDGRAQMPSREKMLAWYAATAKKYPLISIEDGFAEDDWDGFIAMKKEMGDKILLVGDDLTVTNVARINEAAQKNAVNACIIKPNQVGTVSEAADAARVARAAGWKLFASHRSGETLDTFIADFAVGLACDYIKAGAPTKPERTAKYTRLIEIEDTLHTV